MKEGKIVEVHGMVWRGVSLDNANIVKTVQ
jgi:hypothetical protein